MRETMGGEVGFNYNGFDWTKKSYILVDWLFDSWIFLDCTKTEGIIINSVIE